MSLTFDIPSGEPFTFRLEQPPEVFQVGPMRMMLSGYCTPVCFRHARLSLHGATGSVTTADDGHEVTVLVIAGREYQVRCLWPDGLDIVLMRGKVVSGCERP